MTLRSWGYTVQLQLYAPIKLREDSLHKVQRRRVLKTGTWESLWQRAAEDQNAAGNC